MYLSIRQYIATLACSVALCVGAMNDASMDTFTGIFRDDVRTLTVCVDDYPGGLPLLVKDSGQQLVIGFDHLADDREWLRYRLIHCDAAWRPSNIVESEYLDGFNEEAVDDYDFSRATTVHYVHYRIVLPNEHMQPLLSGNYLLQVYSEDDPDTPWLQCRFMISEATARVSADVTSRTDIDYNREHQQLSISVDTERSDVDDIFNDLQVVIVQNGRTDNRAYLRQPLRVQGRTAFYEHQPNLIFEAGNEYRRFETVSTNFTPMGVEYVDYHAPYYHFTLGTDGVRAREPYLFDSTQHGAFVVREYNSTDSDVEADYAVVHFTLDMPYDPDLSVWLDGDLVQRRFDSNSAMTFNPETELYERNLLLKQGAYNYQYLTARAGDRQASAATVEGNKYQTVNRYDILIYNRQRGERYDRLIGAATIYSGR